MWKQKPAPRPMFDAATHERLLAIGTYESAFDAGVCDIQFDSPLEPVEGLPEFDVYWFVSGPDRAAPVPVEGLFALWEKYRVSHAKLCEVYRRLLFGIFENSSQGGYDDHQWGLMQLTRPTLQNMQAVVSSAEIRLEQHQAPGDSAPEFEIQVAFVVFWDEHGVAFRLHESHGAFTPGEWTGIGDV